MTKKTVSNILDLNYELAIEEFKKIITGFDSDRDRLITQSKNAGSIDLKNLKNINAFQDLSSQDAKVLNRLIGTISGGYYLRDMITGKAFAGTGIRRKTKKLESVYHDGVKKLARQNFYFYHDSARREGFKRLNLNIKNTMKHGSQGLNQLFIDSETKSEGEPNVIDNVSIGAVEFTKHTLSLAKRYGDALSVFYNAIPSIDMSLCAPYLNVKILVPENNIDVKSMSHEVQFRFEKHTPSSGMISKHLNKLKMKNNIMGGNETKYDQFGMENFLSPQTLSNSNIRTADKNIIEPNAPLMTLKNCSITIAGMGVGLFCSKNARLEFILHDRSRLRDIAPLVSPKQFAKSRVVLEYGWSHPQGGPTSSNVVGRFLNSLRDKGVFIVKGSSFNFTDGGHVSVSVDLAMMGSKIPKTASVAAGDYVQSSVFKNEMEEVARLLKKDAASKPEDQTLQEVRKKGIITISNAKGINSLMDRKTFEEIKKLTNKGNKAGYIAAIRKYLNVTDITGEDFKENMAKSINDAIRQKISRLPFNHIKSALEDRYYRRDNSPEPDVLTPDDHFLRENDVTVLTDNQIDASNPFTSLGNVIMMFVAYPLAATYQFEEVQVFFYPFNQHSAGAYVHTTASFPISKKSLENLFKSADEKDTNHINMSVSRFMSKLDSKIIRNPVYEHYGISGVAAKIKLISELSSEDLAEANDSEIANLASIGVTQEMIDTVKDEQLRINEILDLSDEDMDKKSKNAAIAKLNSFKKFKKLLKELAIKQRNEALKTLYKNYKPDDVKANQYDFSEEPKFVLPNLSYYFETVTPYNTLGGKDARILKSIASQFKESNSTTSENKSILRIHVYDEEAIANKSQDLMLTLMNSNEIMSAEEMGRLQFLRQKNRFGLNKNKKSPIDNLTYKDIKRIIKQSMPSITLGSSMSNVMNFSAQSSTSNEIANTIFITEQRDSGDVGIGHQGVTALDNLSDMIVVPAVGSLSSPGMPLLQRAQQFFVDANTGTTIDSIYTIQSVNHTIGEGGFKTTAKLIYTGQNRIDTLRTKLNDLIEPSMNLELTEKQKQRRNKRQSRKNGVNSFNLGDISNITSTKGL
jgi:hypothetical protein